MLDLQTFIARQQEMDQQNSPFFQLGSGMGEEIKRQQDEQRRQKNIETQMTNAQKMMEQMAQYGDMSSNAKAGSITETDGRKGVVSATPMIPVREFTQDENGQPSIKIGFRAANPTEQKNLLDIQQAKLEQAKSEELRQHALGYIQGTVPESVMAEVIVKNGGKPEDLIQLRGLRDSTRGQGTPIPSGFQVNEMKPDQFGNIAPSAIGRTPIPTNQDKLAGVNLEQAQMDLNMNKAAQEQAANGQMQVPEGYRMAGYAPDQFGNMRPKGIEPIPQTEVKAQKDMEATDKADQDKIVLAKTNAQNALSSIAEIRKSMGYFGRIDANLPATPGTEKVAWTKNIDRIKGMLTLDKLMELKNASKNGASGMGALSDGERFMLQDAASALDRGLPKEVAERYLAEIEKTLTRVLGGQGGQAQSGQPGGDVRSQYNALRASGVSAEQAKAQLGL